MTKEEIEIILDDIKFCKKALGITKAQLRMLRYFFNPDNYRNKLWRIGRDLGVSEGYCEKLRSVLKKKNLVINTWGNTWTMTVPNMAQIERSILDEQHRRER